MILLFMIAVLLNRTHAQCSVDGANVLCQADYNIAECDWDDGDCCEETCKSPTSNPRVCGVNTPFDCKNPSYAPTEATLAPTPSPTCTVIAADSDAVIGNAICDDEYNILACQYDGGDCCIGSCNDTLVNVNCGFHGFDCKDPDYVTPSPTSFYESLSAIGGTYKDTSANVYCMDHHHPEFATVGNWEVSDGTGLTFDIEQAPDGSGDKSDYYENCLVNHTKSTCEAQEFVANDGLHVMTYCCALDIWVIGFDVYDEVEGSALVFAYYATSESGTIDGLKEWYGDALYGWDDDDYKTFGSVRIVEGGCETTGLIMIAVLAVIFIGILIGFCYKFGIKNCGSVLDAFEKQAARIELIIIGICFGDSFISSIFITIPLPMSVVSKGIVVMFFTVISLLLFGVRMYITKAHILESESIGSLADFTFDLGLGILLAFLYFDVGAFDPLVVFFVLLGTYAGIVEEFLQLLSHWKNEKAQNAIECYLNQSGRVLSTINMLLLLLFSAVMVFGPVGTGWAVFLCILSFIMLNVTVYSWYAYVGCCGCGGHKKPRENDDKGEEEAGDEETGDKAEDKAEDGANKEEDEEARPSTDGKAEDGDGDKAGDDGRAEMTNI